MAKEPAVDYKLLFERSSGLYLVLDPDFRILAASENYCRATHSKPEDLAGRPVFELAGDGAALRDSLRRVAKSLRPDAMPIYRRDVAAAGGAREERYWSALNVPVTDTGGVLRWIVHRIHDVTRSVLEPGLAAGQQTLAREQDQIIQRLRSANEELAQLDGLRQGLEEMSRLNTISLMASALAHDVSQPLTAARNYIGALRRNWSGFDDARAEDVMARIAGQIDRAGAIVKGLQSLISVGVTPHRPENVAAMIGAAAKLAGSSFASAGAHLVLDVAPGLPEISVDRVQFLQLLVCLLENAAEATEDTAERDVLLTARQDGDRLDLSIADSGIGLPDEIAALLADPYAATRLIGSGLGLPIAQQVLKMHGGELEARPNTPHGTVFRFSLPFRGPPAIA